MVRGYTTIEQSKKLLSLGLDPSTADMHYREWKRATKDIRIAHVGKALKEDLPAWSLTALLELMPCPIILNGNFAYPIVNLFSKSITYDVGMAEYHIEKGYDLIDAAVKLVIWLIEQGYIKVNK